jgi:hypothetical protein
MTYFDHKFNAEIPLEPYRGLVFESFTRAISSAPIENRRAVYQLIATDCYHRCVEDLYALAEASRLLEQFGAVTVQNDLASAFGWRRS